MRFFERQKFDEIGNIGVKIEKIIIFLFVKKKIIFKKTLIKLNR